MNVFNEQIESEASAEDQLIHWKHDTIISVTGEWPLKLAHYLLGYAVGMTDINRPGWPMTKKQTHRNKFEQNLFPQETAKNALPFF